MAVAWAVEMPSVVWQMYLPLSEICRFVIMIMPRLSSNCVLPCGKYPSALVHVTGKLPRVMWLRAWQVKLTLLPMSWIFIVGDVILTTTVVCGKGGRVVPLSCLIVSPKTRWM